MSELHVSIDKVPAHCEVRFVFCGPITCANARNIDTGVTGPLVSIDETLTLRWADLDPDGVVGTP
jgi:hypothetical protein